MHTIILEAIHLTVGVGTARLATPLMGTDPTLPTTGGEHILLTTGGGGLVLYLPAVVDDDRTLEI